MSGLERFSLPLADPLETAAETIDAREGFLVRVEGGVGEATPLPGWTEPLEECRAALGAALERPEGALADLEGAPAARHGLSLALADREARRAGRPLYRGLGAPGRVETVPVNATVGDGSPAETADAARRASEAGYSCLKLKVGARPLDADLERVGAAREAVGPHVELRVDANGAWSRPVARRAFEGLAEHGVVYVEQPLPPGNLAGHAALRGGPVDVALDESLADASPGAVLDAGAADVLILKPMVLGGIDRAAVAAARARAAGLLAVVTTTVDGAVARAGAVHLAASLPSPPACGLATGGRLARDLAPDPAPVSGGQARVPQGNGNGVRPGGPDDA